MSCLSLSLETTTDNFGGSPSTKKNNLNDLFFLCKYKAPVILKPLHAHSSCWEAMRKCAEGILQKGSHMLPPFHLFFSGWNIPNEFRSSQMKSDGRNKHPSHHIEITMSRERAYYGLCCIPLKFIC